MDLLSPRPRDTRSLINRDNIKGVDLAPGLKRCNGCGLVKDISKDYYGRTTKKGERRPYSRCKVCHRLLISDWQKRNPERLASRARSRYLVKGSRHQLTRKYKMTEAEMENLMLFLGNRCAICREGPGARALAIDHDHNGGEVRGLLCVRCNVGIGMFRDKPDLLGAAARYLSAGGSTDHS